MTAEVDQYRMVKWNEDALDEVRLKDIAWGDGAPIRESETIVLGGDDRLYFRSRQPHQFDFIAVSFFSTSSVAGDYWKNDDLEVSRCCHGVAYFDGVRHLWMPYVSYPNVNTLTKLMQELANLEDRFCSMPSRKD